MLALLLAWKTIQVLCLPKEVTLLGLVSAASLTVVGPDWPAQTELEELIPADEMDQKDPTEIYDCYRKLWSTYRFRLTRYRLDQKSVVYATATFRKDGEILFILLNDREDSPKVRTKPGRDRLWLGTFSVNPATGKCFTYGTIHGNKEAVDPEPWKAAWVEFLDRLSPSKRLVSGLM